MNISNLQITEMNWHKGLTQASHLSSLFLTEPDIASQVVINIYNKQSGYKNALTFLTGGLGKSEEVNGIQYRWAVMGDSNKAIPISKAVYDHTAGTPGISYGTFKIGVPENWFTYGDIILPDDPRYKLRVKSEPFFDGNDWILVLELATNVATDFIPESLLQVGKELSIEFNAVEHDHSRTSGETRYATPLWLENYLTTIRKKYSITGAAHERVLVVNLVDPRGKSVANTWIKYNEWVFWQQFMDEKEIMLMFGTSNVQANTGSLMKGVTGNPIYLGAGLESQIAPGNKRYYTTLTERVIRDWMNDLAFNGTEDGPREYVALCGRGFVDLFDQAMKVAARQWTLVDTHFITGSGQDLKLSGQFKTYVGLNGDTITLKEYAPYNSTVRNRLLHPKTGIPAESYKATFLNFKSYQKSADAGIKYMYGKGRDMVSTYIEGLYGPYGPKKSGSSASAVDGYEFHVMSECGIKLGDPTNAAQLLLDVDAI